MKGSTNQPIRRLVNFPATKDLQKETCLYRATNPMETHLYSPTELNGKLHRQENLFTLTRQDQQDKEDRNAQLTPPPLVQNQTPVRYAPVHDIFWGKNKSRPELKTENDANCISTERWVSDF